MEEKVEVKKDEIKPEKKVHLIRWILAGFALAYIFILALGLLDRMKIFTLDVLYIFIIAVLLGVIPWCIGGYKVYKSKAKKI